MKTHNGWTNYATRAVALRVETMDDLNYLKEAIEEKQEELSQDGSVFGDLFCIEAINRQEIENSIEQ